LRMHVASFGSSGPNLTSLESYRPVALYEQEGKVDAALPFVG